MDSIAEAMARGARRAAHIIAYPDPRLDPTRQARHEEEDRKRENRADPLTEAWANVGRALYRAMGMEPPEPPAQPERPEQPETK